MGVERTKKYKKIIKVRKIRKYGNQYQEKKYIKIYIKNTKTEKSGKEGIR